MQTFEELEKKLLNEHHDLYVSFTRLLLTLSTGSLTLLVAFRGSTPLQTNDTSNITLILTWSLFIISIITGVLVQYRLMMRPLDDINNARISNENAKDNQPIKLFRKPKKRDWVAFSIQVYTFIFAVTGMALYTMVKI